ncbi:hypothetical protein [Jiangella sp. DSM 45060]|uniref:hypothetical protein n=1 Tax=Jiangella sp. DSM 45060 TaxID=1798224 RepID=UPI00087B74C8|nr:hypothetical protein [Jiangella sp. DSM 45060]SDT30771.1 hypothetical protein SAMN04515669_3487 [Jiangella sp. DSM 45060]
MIVTRTADGVSVGPPPAHPERTALVEAAGALLTWDVVAPTELPSATVHDTGRAAGWLWELYGVDVAAAVQDATPDGIDVAAVPADRRVLDAVRTLARLTWAEAWWPASAAAGVLALDRGLLRAERAVAAAAAEHLLDDDEAVERALAVAAPPHGHPELAAALVAVAEDYGVALPAAVVTPERAGLALAAGGPGDGAGVLVARGSTPVSWTDVPPGLVDAAAEASWTIRRADDTVVEVSVPAAPDPWAPATALRARFGPADVVLAPTREGLFAGTATIPASALLLPAAERAALVYVPALTTAPEPVRPDDLARRAAIVAAARARPAAPDATLTERAAT